MQREAILQVTDLKVSYGRHQAVRGISFDVRKAETYCMVGESGSGKSSTGRAIARLVPVESGSIKYRGQNVTAFRGESLRDYRRKVQMIFQDTVGALNPRLSIRDSVEEPLRLLTSRTRHDVRRAAAEMLDRVGLDSSQAMRYPPQLSGGQRQRACIARALMLEPELVICDEPVSALDLSVQARVLDVLAELGRDRGLSYLFITHDLGVVRRISDRVAVMKDGLIVEEGENHDVLDRPRDPYTRRLIEAIPKVPVR